MDIVIEEKDIQDYLHASLVKYGYAPGLSEVEDLAEIVFEYLIDKLCLEELDDFTE